MPTTVDLVQLAMEESPRYEGAPATTPYRVSTTVHYLPGQNARVSPNPQLLDRSDEMRGIEGGVAQLIDGYDPDGAIAIRAYPNSLTWILQTLGLTGAYVAGGATVTDENETTAVGVNALNSATLNVVSTAEFPTSGTFIMGGVATTYSGKTDTSFTGCGNHAATTGGEVINGNIPVNANKWTFTKRGGITAKTLQMILAYVDEATFLRGQGFGCSQLGVTADGAVTAEMQGLVVARIADPNLTPTFDSPAIPHLRRGDLYLSWLTGSGVTEDFSVSIANPLVKRRTLGRLPSSYFPDVMEHGTDRVRLTGSIPKTVLDPDDYDAMVAATSFAAKARWKSPTNIGATSYPYTMWIRMPAVQYVGGGPDEISNARRFGQSLDFWAAWDVTAGYDFRITLANAITSAALETL